MIKKQDRVIEDSTFGLKNKNKSKKVQQFIERVEKTGNISCLFIYETLVMIFGGNN